MAYSDDYLRQLSRKAVKGEILDAEAVRNLFFQYISELPEDLKWDIFNQFFDEPEPGEARQKAEKLSVVIDLFEGEYEENALDLTNDELQYISESVNDFALELTDEVLMNVMRAAVSRGLMG